MSYESIFIQLYFRLKVCYFKPKLSFITDSKVEVYIHQYHNITVITLNSQLSPSRSIIFCCKGNLEMMNIAIALLLCFCISVKCLINPLQIRKSNVLIIKQTHLNAMIHEAAEAGDLEKVMAILEKNPELISSYDIDGN